MAIASLRRPVPAPCPVTTGRRVTARPGTSCAVSVVYSDGAPSPYSSSPYSVYSTSSSSSVWVAAGSVTFSVLYFYCSICVISYGCGCCAWCGWSGPAYTLSLRSVFRPREFFGSMPRTAFSTTRSGRVSIRLA